MPSEHLNNFEQDHVTTLQKTLGPWKQSINKLGVVYNFCSVLHVVVVNLKEAPNKLTTLNFFTVQKAQVLCSPHKDSLILTACERTAKVDSTIRKKYLSLKMFVLSVQGSQVVKTRKIPWNQMSDDYKWWLPYKSLGHLTLSRLNTSIKESAWDMVLHPTPIYWTGFGHSNNKNEKKLNI